MKHRIAVIAEAGVAHAGKIERALRLVQVAKDAGCWGVKFQIYDPKLLEHPKTRRPMGGMPFATSALETLTKWRLTDDGYAETRKLARKLGIKWGASVFDVPSVTTLAKLNPDFVKFPCGAPDEVVETSMDTHALYHCMLFGSYTPNAIPDYESHIGIRMACVPKYPCDVWDYFPMNTVPEGISDHTGRWQSAYTWRTLGIEYAEVHIALSNDDPDANVSLMGEDIAAYVHALNEKVESCPNPKGRYWTALRKISRGAKIEPWVDAAPLRDVTAKRLCLKCPAYARKDYRKGETL